MISLQRKRLLKRQAASDVAAVRKTEALARTTQVAHSTVAVGDADVPVVDVAVDATTAAADLPGVQDEVAQVATDAYDASVDAGAAKSAADSASEVAVLAKTTADGRNRIYAQMVEPVTLPDLPFVQGDLWYRLDALGRIAEVRIWNGTLWGPFQLVAGSLLVPGSVGNVLIGDGAIDGKTITGALIRTAASGQRLQLDVNGLRAFNTDGLQTALLSSSSGGFRVGGLFEVAAEGDPQRAFIQKTGLQVESGSSLVGGVRPSRASVEPSRVSASRRSAATVEAGTYGEAISEMTTGADEAMARAYFRPPTSSGAGVATGVSMVADEASGRLNFYGPGMTVPATIEAFSSRLNFRYYPVHFETSVSFLGDTDWVYPTLLAGTNIAGNEFGYCRKNGVVWLTGRVNTGDGVTIFQMPAGFRILGGADNVRLLDRGGPCRVNFKGTGHIEVISGGLVGGGVSFAGTSYIAAP